MISRIDHVSIAVGDYEGARRFFQDLLGAVPGTGREDPDMKYFWQLFSLGDLSRMELMKATGTGSFLDNFLDSRGSGVHHITLETPDIEKTRRLLEESGIPYFGFNNTQDRWKELFIHPRDAYGVLIQIAEFKPGDWLDPSVMMSAGRRFSVSRTSDGYAVTFAHPGGGRATVTLSASETRLLIDELKTALREEEQDT